MKYPSLYQFMQEPEHSQNSSEGTTEQKEQDPENQVGNVKVSHQMGLATTRGVQIYCSSQFNLSKPSRSCQRGTKKGQKPPVHLTSILLSCCYNSQEIAHPHVGISFASGISVVSHRTLMNKIIK